MVQSAKSYLLKIYVKEGEKKADGKKFNYYKTTDKQGKLVDVRFTKECRNIPTKTSMIVVKAENINLDIKREYPCYWVKAIEEIREVEYKQNDLPFEEVE